MVDKKNTRQEFEALKRENDILKRENRYLKKLTTSKRFRFAEKVATGYNGIFPKNTRRRNALEKVGEVGTRCMSVKKRYDEQKIARNIAKLANGYERVIVLNSVPWDLKLKQRPHHLATEFAKAGFFVVYLEYNNLLQNFRVIQDNLITVNSEVFVMELVKKCQRCYFLSPNNMPTRYTILKKVVDVGFEFIYDYLDEFHEDISGDLSIQMEVWNRLPELKPIICTATATRLYDDLKKHLGKEQKVVMARNAVIVEHFDFEKNKTATPPNDLKEIIKKQKPIVGFYGALAPWIDFKMLNEVAKNHQEWEFVYLGVDYNGAAAELEEGKNVHNLGAKNYKNLPKYAKYFNVAMIPFKHGEIAKATSPVKLFEYMAAGLPTVCTRDLQECKGYEYVYISKDRNEFEKNIKLAILKYKELTVRQKLLEQAKENTWKKRVQEIIKSL